LRREVIKYLNMHLNCSYQRVSCESDFILMPYSRLRFWLYQSQYYNNINSLNKHHPMPSYPIILSVKHRSKTLLISYTSLILQHPLGLRFLILTYMNTAIYQIRYSDHTRIKNSPSNINGWLLGLSGSMIIIVFLVAPRICFS